MSLIDSASLIVTPNAYKEGTLYSVIPSNGSGDLSVTRATTATRVNSAGLVELVPYNLFSYSEQFNNAYWTKNRSSITANTTTSPNGTLTADSLIENTANGTHEFIAISAAEVQPYTFSIYGKANTRSKIQLVLAGTPFASGGNGEVSFDLSLGTVISAVNGATGTIQNIGNGWYRCTITKAASVADPSGVVAVRLLDASGNSSYTGDGTSSAYFWGAQLVEGSVAKDYQKTETRLNIPRLDYSNGTCPSILVEPQRTNLLLQSSSFNNAAWTKNVSVSANSIVSPSGIQDADKILENASNVNQWAYQSLSLSGAQTATIYAKKAERNYVALATGGLNPSYFNLDTGVVVSSAAGANASIQSVGNGWYRCSVTTTNSTSPFFVVWISDNGSRVEYSGDASKGIYVWGGQNEAGSYATSYIPTTSASVTRNADVISKTGISSLIGQTEGSVFLDFEYLGGTVVFNAINDGTNSNRIQIECNSSGVATMYVFSSSSAQAAISLGTLSKNTRYKFAGVYKQNDFVAYLNGSFIGSDTSGNVPASLSRFEIGSEIGSSYAGLELNAAVLWKTRLTNDELERLTGVGFNTYTEMANYYNYIIQ